MARPRLLTLMGSGETAPTMAKVHRALRERLDTGPLDAVLLDKPYGFQVNAENISRRTVAYFARHLEVRLGIANWPSASVAPVAREQALDRVRAADYVFAGPGSPSYALEVWRDSPLRGVLADKLRHGGCVTFASAAAVTLGVAAVPVYEIYKVGAAPHWLQGLDLLAEVGLRAAVVPHYDNAEGGTHDTRFCYLGERRLRQMEADLPTDAFILGVDEHTACVLDLDARDMTVLGRGTVTLRRQGHSTALASGSVLPFDQLAAPELAATPSVTLVSGEAQPPASPPSLRAEAERLERDFTEALHRDVPAGVGVVLELEQTVFDWAGDTEAADLRLARAALRGMVARLGALAASSGRDPREPMTPLIEALVELRDGARARRSWAAADHLRERLAAGGVEVRDTPDGSAWRFRDRDAGR